MHRAHGQTGDASSHTLKHFPDPTTASLGARLAHSCCNQGVTMPRGSKGKYSDKQKRKAEHIEEGYEKRGASKTEAKRRAWATVNAIHGGGEKSGSGRGK